MKTLLKLAPKRGFQKDFYVFDVETKVKVDKNNFEDLKSFNPFLTRKDYGKYVWGLRAKSENFCFGVIYGFNFVKVINSVEDFKKELKEPRYKDKKVFAHNATYDLDTIYNNIFKLDPKAIFNGRFISATNGNCMFADSMNIYGFSVKKIGALLNLPKLELEQEKATTETLKEYTEADKVYCIRDCEIVYKALFLIFDKISDIKITAASCAMIMFRRFYQPYHIDYNERLVEHFYTSYFGGRTEAFKIGDTNAQVIDVNSMYPYAMKHTYFPNPKTFRKIKKPKIKRVIHYIRNYEGCANVKVFHRENYFGHLPTKKNNKLIFPLGTFSGVWNFNELRYALESEVIDILECEFLVYSKPQPSIFADYVDANFKDKSEARSTGNKIGETLAKLFLNTLYGKFAQKIDTDSEYIEDFSKSLDYITELQEKKLLKEIKLFSEERNDCFIIKKSLIAKSLTFTIPSYASYITSECRVLLLKELKKCYNQDGCKPVYCDTDSIFFEGNYKFKNSDELGEWKLEEKIVTKINGLKNYTSIQNGVEHRNIKGVPKNAEQVDANTYIYKNLVKTKESLVRQMESGVLIERKKVIKNTYDKRSVDENGNTKPLKL